MPDSIHHALVLNLHQPAGNLQELLVNNPWETHEILYAMDRIPRSLWGYEDVGRVHLALSGTLLETLSDPAFQCNMYGVVDCGSLLWHYQNTALFRILGTGFYHPVLPLIPEADREEHVRRWLGIASHLFWRSQFQGFWPPEMGFSMELIPMLRRQGFRYVLVDSDHVEAVTPMSWHELRYRPHIARYGGEEFVLMVAGMEVKAVLAFAERIRARVEKMFLISHNVQPPSRTALDAARCARRLRAGVSGGMTNRSDD